MRVFWKRREREAALGLPKVSGPLSDSLEGPAMQPLAETIEIERDVPRAAAISRIAEELRRRDEEVVEIFKVISSRAGQAVLPIHLRRGGKDVFVEIEPGPWKWKNVWDVLKTAAVLRRSEHWGAVFEVLAAYPVPEELRYFCGRSPAALFQLDLLACEEQEKAEACSEVFRRAVERHWGLSLDHNPEGLPVVEDQLLAALGEGTETLAHAPILDVLVHGFGCYAGEVLRRHAAPQSSWRSAADWGEGFVLEFSNTTADPIGKARAFFENGPEDSVAYYVAYALKELNG